MEKLLEESKKFLVEAFQVTKSFLGQMTHGLADMHIDPNESGNLYNVLNGLEALVGEFLNWLKQREEEKKKEEEAAKEKAKQQAKGGSSLSSITPEDLSNFLKSDEVKKFLSDDSVKNILNSDLVKGVLNSDLVTNLIGSEFISNTLKQFSGVIKENADLIKQIAPKNLADKLLSFTVPADQLSQQIKKPENYIKGINQVINQQQTTIKIEDIQKNLQGYKSMYDRSKEMVNKTPTGNELRTPQEKTAAITMAKLGPALIQANPQLGKEIEKDFDACLRNNKQFRDIAVAEARNRLKPLSPETFSKLPAEAKSLAELDIKILLTGLAADGMLPNSKGLSMNQLINENFKSFVKDPSKGITVLSNKAMTNNASQRMTYAAQNPTQPRPALVNESPIPKFNNELKTDMLKSKLYRDEKVKQAQAHLKSVLEKSGINSQVGVDNLPQGVKAEIAKDISTIYYGYTADAALKNKGVDHLSTPESLEKYVNNDNLNKLTKDVTQAMLKTPNADYSAFLKNDSMTKYANAVVNKNEAQYKNATSAEPETQNLSTDFNVNTKADILKSRELRGDMVINARKNINDIVEKHNLTDKASYDKLPADVKTSLDNSIKTIGYAYAADQGLQTAGKLAVNSGEVRNQLANSNGLNWAADNTLEEFYKNPQEGLKTLFDNKKMQQNGKNQIADFAPEISNVVKNDTVPNKSYLVNQQLGVQNRQHNPIKNERPIEHLDENLKKDMLKSAALRSEKMDQAVMRINDVVQKNGPLTKENLGKLPKNLQESLDNDFKTVAFGLAANETLGMDNKGKISDPKVQDELLNSQAFNNIVDNAESVYRGYYDNLALKQNSVLDYNTAKSSIQFNLDKNQSELKGIVQHDQIKNEEPIESFDENLKVDMLKSKAFRAEKVNEAQQHIKSVMEQNGVKTNEDFGKLPKTVRDSIDKDIKTITYGHIADEALRRNGMNELSNEAMQNKFVHSKTTDSLINQALKNFESDPISKMGTLLNNNKMQLEASKLNSSIGETVQKDVFNDDLKKGMLNNKKFRDAKIDEATNNLQGILDKTGPMTKETYDKLSPEMKESFDANFKTLMYGQYANSALRMTGVNDISDPKIMENMLNSKNLNGLVETSYNDFFTDPSKNAEICLNKDTMHNLAKSVVQTKENKTEFFDILQPDDLDLDLNIDINIKNPGVAAGI